MLSCEVAVLSGCVHVDWVWVQIQMFAIAIKLKLQMLLCLSVVSHLCIGGPALGVCFGMKSSTELGELCMSGVFIHAPFLKLVVRRPEMKSLLYLLTQMVGLVYER